jgi:hypothetical protein
VSCSARPTTIPTIVDPVSSKLDARKLGLENYKERDYIDDYRKYGFQKRRDLTLRGVSIDSFADQIQDKSYSCDNERHPQDDLYDMQDIDYKTYRCLSHFPRYIAALYRYRPVRCNDQAKFDRQVAPDPIFEKGEKDKNEDHQSGKSQKENNPFLEFGCGHNLS